MLEAKIIVNEGTAIDKEISLLEREATTFAKQNWGKAIECLQKVKLLRDSESFIPAFKSYLRLPEYLQRAGRIDEALIEFEDLIEKTQNHKFIFIQKSSYYTDELYQSICKQHEIVQLAAIYESMSKTYKREKDIEKSQYYANLQENYVNKAEKLFEKNNKQEAKLYQKHRKAIELKRQQRNKGNS